MLVFVLIIICFREKRTCCSVLASSSASVACLTDLLSRADCNMNFNKLPGTHSIGRNKVPFAVKAFVIGGVAQPGCLDDGHFTSPISKGSRKCLVPDDPVDKEPSKRRKRNPWSKQVCLSRTNRLVVHVTTHNSRDHIHRKTLD